MSLNSILQKIQQKGQIRVLPVVSKPKPEPVSVKPVVSSNRPVDPVVARLKAARKAEKEKKEQEMREKKGLAPKREVKRRPTKTTTVKPRTSQPSQSSRKGNGKPVPAAPVRGEKKVKMSFSELMKKASLIDQSKMSIEIKQKTKSPETVPRTVREKDSQNNGSILKPIKNIERNVRTDRPDRPDRPDGTDRNGRSDRKIVRREQTRGIHEKPETRPVRAPLPARKPSEKLQAQLKGRNAEVESDSDNDSFIASDEEEVSHAGYDRDEIWSMFNRGRKRSYYDRYDDEDSDDMEATGAEIFEEELRSKRQAMQEDMREMKEEQRLAALKQARKKGKK